MARTMLDVSGEFADRALKQRQLREQEQSSQIDQATKLAALQESGYTVNQQPRSFFGGGGVTVTRDPSFESSKTLERRKLSDELEMNQFKLNRMRSLNQPVGDAQEPSAEPSGATTPRSLVPKTFDEYGLPNTYYNPDEELRQKRAEEAQKPLSPEASGKLEGARQTVEQIGSVKALANKNNFEDRKKSYTKIKMGQKFGITDPTSIKGNIINTVGFGIPKQMVETSDDDKKFELAVNLIAENNLRARTGAAAPTAEQIREEARQLVGDDTYESFLNRMGVSEKYATGIAEGIRPGSSQQFGQNSTSGASSDYSQMSDEELRKLAAL